MNGQIMAGRIISSDGMDLKNNKYRTIRLNPSTHALVAISYPHHEVHEGSAFWTYQNSVLANGEVCTLSITTPDTTKWLHLLMNIELTAVATFDVLEDVTSFSGGGASTIRNFKRNSTNTSVATALRGDTTSNLITPTGGTEIWSEVLGVRGVHTSRENSQELILKQNSNYLFRITNSTAANTVTILLNWYEHTDKD